jgi:hypothetical protein
MPPWQVVHALRVSRQAIHPFCGTIPLGVGMSGPDDAGSQAPLVFPSLVMTGALLMWGAAVAIVGSIAQIGLLFTFYDTAWRFIPYPLGAITLGLFLVGRRLYDARPGSPAQALVLTSVAAALSLAWFGFTVSQGTLVPLPALAAGLSALATLVVALCVRPVARYHVALRALQAGIDRDGAFGGSLAYPDAGSARPMLLGLAGATLVGGALLWGMNDPLSVQRLWLRVRLLATARLPVAADGFIGPRVDYGYEGSPWLRYATYESRWTPVDVETIGAFADGIAEEVGWRMMVWTGERDVVAAERALWARGEADRIPMWIAHGLRERDVFYHQESLLSRSFDPTLHDGDEVHLDCDLLVHLFEHVAWRLDLDFREMAAPMHVYLSYAPPEGVEGAALTVEATSFRRIDIDGNHIDFMGEGVGEDFFVPADWYATGKNGTWASDDLMKAAQLYQPQDDRAVQDSILANVLAGLDERHVDAPTRAEATANLDGTRSYVLVSNVWSQIVKEGQEALDRDDLATAIDDAREATALRDRFPHLVLTVEPIDRQLLAEGLVASGAPDLIAQAGPVMDQALEVYRSPVFDDAGAPMAADEHHATLLLLDASVRGVSDEARCDQTLGRVARWIAQGGRGTDAISLSDVCAVAAESPRACAALRTRCVP